MISQLWRDFKVVRGWGDALTALNGTPNGGNTTADTASIKQKVAAMYDWAAPDSSRGLLWNWGMYHEGVNRKVGEALPGYDKYESDGHSEQLYYYVLDQVPRKPEPRRILEVGSSFGLGLNFLSRVEGKSEFVGLDLSRECVERANARLGRPGALSFVPGDAENLPFGAGAFDVVINIESAHHYPDLARFFREVARVLRPGGYFSMVDLYTDRRLELFNRCKVEMGDELDWVRDTDVSDYVKASIRRRLAPGSPFRRRVEEGRSLLYRATATHAVMESYGGVFLNPKSSEFVVSSYRHTLARKPL
jgi:SAM-dependent methyltransferase